MFKIQIKRMTTIRDYIVTCRFIIHWFEPDNIDTRFLIDRGICTCRGCLFKDYGCKNIVGSHAQKIIRRNISKSVQK